MVIVKINQNFPLAIILGLNLNGLGVLQTLSKRGIRTIGMDSNPHEIGFLSRYGRKVVCPSGYGLDLLNFLIDLGSQLNDKSIIFPTTDSFVLFVSKYREKLLKYFKFSLPSQEIVEKLINKGELYDLASKYGISTPKTFVPNNLADVYAIGKKIEYPCIIKPYFSFILDEIDYVRNPRVIKILSFDHLIDTYSRISNKENRLIIQEIIPGEIDQIYFLGGYFDSQSEPISIHTGVKIRQHEFGSTSLAENIWEPYIVELTCCFFKQIGYSGLVDIEFKRDKRDKLFKLIEVNVRTGLWHKIMSFSDSDPVLVAYKDLIGQKQQQYFAYKEKIKWINLERDIQLAIHQIIKRELNFYKWFQSMKGKKIYANSIIDDPLPAIYGIYSFLVYYLKKVHFLL